MNGLRRSGRIRKDVPIVLLGTDATGRVFSEETRTVVLSRHGAGIVSSKTFAPEEVLTLRFSDSSREADVRLVGRIGDTPKGFIYGVEFLDPSINHWGLEFPPPEDYSEVPRGISLQCTICHLRRVVEQSEIEADVFLATGSVFRPCEQCGQATAWRKWIPALAAAQGVSPPGATLSLPSAATATPALQTGVLPNAMLNASPKATTVLERLQPGSSPMLSPPAPTKRQNRRKHVRTRVSFTACIRFPLMGDELVECENVSKGGLCFLSKKRYPEEALVEIAAPYEPGTPGIFVRAQIKRIEQVHETGLFRYGAAYGQS
ncbi:MAG TPA: PilZ domain-containing protein [Candidatus Acidoferrum sp.]|nr:PilZ domain-containing protein [Candidatus Acidoferrum sp.]